MWHGEEVATCAILKRAQRRDAFVALRVLGEGAHVFFSNPPSLQLIVTHGLDVLVFAMYATIKDMMQGSAASGAKQSVLQTVVQGFAEKQKLPQVVMRAMAAVQRPPEGLLGNVCKMLKLPLEGELLLLVGLGGMPSGDGDVIALLKARLEGLAANKEASTMPLSAYHAVLAFVQRHPEEISPEEEALLLEALKKAHPTAGSTALMYPLLSVSRAPSVLPVAVVAPNRKRLSGNLITKLRASATVADLMEDLGYASAATAENLKVVLAQFPALKPADVARIVGMMSRTHTGLEESAMLHTFAKNSTWSARPGLKTWNINVFVDTVKEMYTKLSWQAVIQGLDHAEFQLYDSRGFALILAVYRRATKAAFPVDALFGLWTNTSVQLSMLKLAVACPPETFSFYSLPAQAALDAFPNSIKAAASTQQVQHWFSVALIATLLGLSEVENYSLVRLIFDLPLKNCPELLLLGLTQIKKRNALHVELCDQLMSIFLSNHPNSAWVLTRVWNANANNAADQSHRAIVMRGLVQAYQRDPSCLPRLLDVSQVTLKALTTILQGRPYSFTLALATLAKHREFLSLVRWLPQRIQEGGDEFLQACIVFVTQKVTLKSDNFFTPEILGMFIKAITPQLETMSPVCQDAFQQLQRALAVADGTAPAPGFDGAAAAVAATPGGAGPAASAGAAQLPPNSPGSVPASTNPNAVTTAGGQREVFPAHIEKRANTLFQQIYTGALSIDEAIRLLQTFKDATNENHDVFACMLHSLFDEFRFFASYPDKELQITGILFGKLIQHQLISHVPLGIAFRYVLEALRKPANSKMFKFGALALDQFKGRLHEWPQYCAFLAQIPHLRQLNPKLMEWVDRAKGSAEATPGLEAPGTLPSPPQASHASASNNALPPDPAVLQVGQAASGLPTPNLGALASNAPQPSSATADGPTTPQRTLAQSQSAASSPLSKSEKDLRSSGPSAAGGNTFSSLPLDLLLASATPIQEPPERIKDRIHFIFNNVSTTNLGVKAKEMREILLDEHQPYLARYIVVKRAAIEPNFQALYVQFMDALVSVLPGLLDAVLAETFHNVRVLIDSEDIASSSSQRTILKNLGSWLGRLTIGKDRPLLHRDLCPKNLILAAYESGKLIVVVPFVAKILAAAAESRVFKPPNAWTMAQLRVLIELYNLPDLKLILKFETEVLCNHLNVDQSEIRPTQLFVNRPEPSGLSLAASSGGTGAEKAVHNLDSFVRIPASASPFFAQLPQLQRLVPLSMDVAIREIIQPVVERSVTIACITTRELVTLDFASEAEEDRLRQAARMMVRSLSGSLAGVTCAEPLRVSMTNHLRSLIQANLGSANKEQLQPLLEQAIAATVQENLELACALIEKSAAERAMVEVEEALSAAYAARVAHAQSAHRGLVFVDPAFAEVFPAVVPPVLRSTPGGLSAAEYRVYEDFTRLPMTFDRYRLLPDVNPEALIAPTRPAPVPGAGPALAVPAASANGDDAVPNHAGADHQQPHQPAASAQALQPQQQLQQPIIETFKTVVQELDKIFVTFGDSPVNALPQAEITNLVRQIPHLILQSGESGPQYAVTFAQVLFTRLFENSSPIFQEIQLVCLKGIRDVAAHITKEVTGWTLGLPEDRAHNYKAILGLVRFQLIQIAVYDAHLAKMLVNAATTKTLELAIFLVKNCCAEGRYAAVMAGEFARTIAVLRSVQGMDGLTQMLDQIARIQQQHQQQQHQQQQQAQLQQQQQQQQHEDDGAAGPGAAAALRDEVINPQLREKVSAFFSQWVSTLFESDRKDPETCLAILRSIGRSNPELASIINAQNLAHLVHVCTSSVVQTAYQLSAQQPAGSATTAWYKYVDSLTPLLVLLVRHAQPGEDAVMPRNESPAKLLIRRLTVVLNVIVKMIIRDHQRGPEFRQRVHFRILVSLLVMLNSSMAVAGGEESEEIKALRLQTALVFSDALMLLSPMRLPGFAFAWMELLSHRSIMPLLLMSQRRDAGWPQFQKLLLELFRFLQPYLRSVELADPVRILYRGTLRILLVLLHDFPEFLCDYHSGFCDLIPSTCVQMRNIILSAYPRTIQQPDPFAADLVVDRLPAIQIAPTIRSDFLATIGRLNNYAKALNVQLSGKQQPGVFVREARAAMVSESPDEIAAQGTRYNIPLINSTVLLCGITAIQNGIAGQAFPLSHPPSLEVITALLMDFDPEGRYAVLNAIANQLRYPNRHTYYFSCLLLFLFASNKQKDEQLQEQIARVLLERLLSSRPYSWGSVRVFFLRCEVLFLTVPFFFFLAGHFHRADQERHVCVSVLGIHSLRPRDRAAV